MKYSYFWALPVAALLSLAGCSNDDTLQADNGKQQNTVPAGMTEFADGGLTRTAGRALLTMPRTLVQTETAARRKPADWVTGATPSRSLTKHPTSSLRLITALNLQRT